jgi:hypothetical protein
VGSEGLLTVKSGVTFFFCFNFNLINCIMARIKLSPLLASIRGSIGSLTFANSQGGYVVKAKPLNLNRKTAFQLKTRNYLSHARNTWHSFSDEKKSEWSNMAAIAAARQKNDRRRSMSGYTYFMKYYMLHKSCNIDPPYGFDPDFYFPEFPSVSPSLTSVKENRVVVGGRDNHTLAYSDDLINWTGLGTSIFSERCFSVCKGGSKWVAVGTGGNTIAHSDDGINWTGLGTSIFTSDGWYVTWNGSIFVAAGAGTNSLAYSSDGVNWTGLGTSVFSGKCRQVIWTGALFVAVGDGGNTLAYSRDGLNWTGLGTSIFSSQGFFVCCNNNIVIAGGRYTNSLAYSKDGITWHGLGTSLFTNHGRAAGWDGRKFLVSGVGGNDLLYSYDGIRYNVRPASPGISDINGLAFNGKYWLASGEGSPPLSYSSDGFSWTTTGASLGNTYSYGLAFNRNLQLFPAVLNQLKLDYDFDFWDVELWARIKMSKPLRSTHYKATSLLRTLETPYADSFPQSFETKYYDMFGMLPWSGDKVLVSTLPFGIDSASLFPETISSLIVQS